MTLTQITKIRGAGIHTTSNIVSHNINSSGIITAVAFKGPFTGSSNIQSGILTATKIDLNGDIDVDGHTNLDNVNVAGVATFTGDATFSGNVSIGGTLTYEDVTNIDSVGIITARDGLKVLAGGANVVGVVTATTFKGNGDFVELDVDGHTNLDNVSIAGVTTASGAIDLNADLDVDGHTNLDNVSVAGVTTFSSDINIVDKIVHTGDSNTAIRFPGNDTFQVETDGSARLKITDGDLTMLDYAAGDKVGIGTNVLVAKLDVKTNANIPVIKLNDSHYNKYLTIRGGGSPNRMVIDSYEGGGGGADIDLASNGSTKVRIKSDGKIGIGSESPQSKLTLTAASGNTIFELQRSNTNTTGAVGVLNFTALDGHSVANIQVRGDGNDEGGAIQFRTTSAAASNDPYASPHNGLIAMQIKSDGQTVLDGSASQSVNYPIQINNSAAAGNGSNPDITAIAFASGASTKASIQAAVYGEGWMTFHNNNNTEKLRIEAGGNILPGAAGTQNLGSTSKEWGDVFLASDKALKLGNSQIGDLYVGSDNVTYLRNSTGQMVIRAAGDIYISDYSGNHRAGFRDNSSVDLYYDIENNATAKLSTTAKGISVHGELAASQDYPNFKPTLDFNFVAVKKLDNRITYTRTSAASYVDEKGIVRVVGDNVPRFDHDSFTGESKGLLIEDARTSRLTASSGNDSYSHFRQTDQGETIKGPDGVENSAREYTVNSNGGTGGTTTIWASEAVGFADPTSVSCFVKITRGSTMAFRIYDNNNALESHKWTISGGAISDGTHATVVQSDPGSTEGTSSYELYPNGWVRLKWEGASNNANATSYIQLYIYDHAAANSDGDNIGYGVWGFQVENGSFCTSVIPKPTTAAVTRDADFVGITGDEHTDFWNTSEGTYLIDYKPLEKAVGNGVIIGSKRGNNGSGYPWPLYRHDTANTNNFKSYDLTNGIVSMSTTWADRRESWALGFNGTNGSIVRNGTQLQTNNANMNGLIDANELWLGSSSTGSLYSMHVKRFMYYAKRITDSQLKTLTS